MSTVPRFGVRRGSGGSGTERAGGSSGVWVYWQGPCVVRGGAASESEALATLPPDTTNATAANALISARFISHALLMIATF
ncbi:hypothetical protein ABT403_36370 [Streptomyces sp. NPDC000075]|uniref:hypothetical protein n=1 Tax=Streptomyces TaxID=1883 RepID=UPI0031D71D37